MVISLLAISVASIGQDKIEGIGKFRLKSTTTEYLDTLAEEKSLKRNSVGNLGDFFNIYKKDELVELIPDTLKDYLSPPHASLCKDVRVFYIPQMTVSTIVLKETFLTFYRDTLVAINTNWTNEIVEALELKYGKGHLDKKEKEVSCTSSLSESSTTYTETMYYQTWQNGDIKCTAALGNYRDSKCEKKTMSYISISVEKVSIMIFDCDRQERSNLNDKKKIEKRKQLEDF